MKTMIIAISDYEKGYWLARVFFKLLIAAALAVYMFWIMFFRSSPTSPKGDKMRRFLGLIIIPAYFFYVFLVMIHWDKLGNVRQPSAIGHERESMLSAPSLPAVSVR
jgi:RsiW-degrading membrane proteinase PrsW (M82 family)